MRAVLTGLDLGQALASLPPNCDLDFARELFVVAERAFFIAYLERLAAEEEAEKEHPDGD